MTMTPEMPKLCGGVLFNLLVNSKRSRHKANDSFMGESDGLSNVNCLKGLIRVFYPDIPATRTFLSMTRIKSRSSIMLSGRLIQMY